MSATADEVFSILHPTSTMFSPSRQSRATNRRGEPSSSSVALAARLDREKASSKVTISAVVINSVSSSYSSENCSFSDMKRAWTDDHVIDLLAPSAVFENACTIGGKSSHQGIRVHRHQDGSLSLTSDENNCPPTLVELSGICDYERVAGVLMDR